MHATRRHEYAATAKRGDVIVLGVVRLVAVQEDASTGRDARSLLWLAPSSFDDVTAAERNQPRLEDRHDQLERPLNDVTVGNSVENSVNSEWGSSPRRTDWAIIDERAERCNAKSAQNQQTR